MSRLGVSEHRWKGVPNDLPMSRAGRERLQEIVAMLRSGALNKVVLLSSPSNDLQQQFGPAAAAVMRHLYEVITGRLGQPHVACTHMWRIHFVLLCQSQR